MNKESFIKQAKVLLMWLRLRMQGLYLKPLVLLKWCVVTAACGIAVSLVYLLYIARDLPNVDTLEQVKRLRRITILDQRNKVITTYGNLYGNYVQFHEVPRHLKNAVLATEDRKFFDHGGVDVLGIFRAMLANIKAGHTVQGASTITQQLAKVVFLTNQRTLKRKLQQVLLAFEIERKYTKEQIFAIYLNKVYLGAGIYGIDAAAKYYFGKNLHDLNLSECAIIAGLIKAPSRYAPTNNPTLSGNRAYQVLLNMKDDGYINQEQFNKASSMAVNLNTEMLGSAQRNHFTEWVYESVGRYVGEEDADVIVKTTYDSSINNTVESVLKAVVEKHGAERNISEGAAVVMDYNGKVLGLVGGVDYAKSPYNRVTQSLRPIGSSAKLFVYLAALDAGFTPETEVEDKPIKFKEWEPENFNRKFSGMLPLKDAFAYSTNTISVQIAHQIGLSRVINTMRTLGVSAPLNQDLTIALGSCSVSLLELITAYGIIGNDGYKLEPYGVTSVRNARTGQFLYLKSEERYQSQIVNRQSAQAMKEMLRHTVLEGTAKQADIPYPIISAKTGTSQDSRDAWFLGYTDKYIIGVWLGNDNYSPMKNVVGGGYPTMIARDILKRITPVPASAEENK
jgi:penicillin-binding protein 1A